eukprot:6202206-Pleurochrysis_carterae.AAC.3
MHEQLDLSVRPEQRVHPGLAVKVEAQKPRTLAARESRDAYVLRAETTGRVEQGGRKGVQCDRSALHKCAQLRSRHAHD